MAGRRENDSPESHEAKVSEAARAYTAALLAGDEVAAEIVIREAMDAHVSSAVIDDEIIAPALWRVGELWARGHITVADEHIATEISIRVLALQREVQRVAQARPGHRVMLAAPAGELHVVALRMVANLLRESGYGVVMLGADVPAHALGAAARRLEPDVICLSSTMPDGADDLLGAIAAVQQEWPSTRFVVGGRGLTPQIQPQSMLGVCGRVSEAVEVVDAMVKRAGLN